MNEPLHPIARDLEPGEGALRSYPPFEKWDDWEEYDAAAWPRKVKRKYQLIPTICFNCEAGCGLTAYVKKDSLEIQRFEGNPEHPGSRGRNCAKGPATLNQIQDSGRIRHPLKRDGKRGEGKWKQVSWDEVLDDLAGRLRKAIQEDRRNEIMYHVGRPGHDPVNHQRIMRAWGVDAHNSHTNVCSAGARAGYTFWLGIDRPSPDHANAKFILLLSAHLETGHYFNPHAQRIIEAKEKGTKIAVIDTRLSNTASMADYWLSTWPGSESAVLLAMANILLKENLHNREFVRRWVNWEQFLREEHPDRERTFETFEDVLREIYAEFTPEFAEKESGISASQIIDVAHEIARAGTAFATHIWRNAAAGNFGGWQVARALEFLVVLVGAVGTPGGTVPNKWTKFSPKPPEMPPKAKIWNELLFPKEFPLAFFEMSFLLPHFLKEGRGRLDTYFTRVYNPVWTNPDGMTWMEVLKDEEKVGLHACLSPTWSETAWFADYILPMGHSSERHDLVSQETHAARWIGFRQPVLRVALEKRGKTFDTTWQAHEEAGIGQIWEEDEFWIELTWRIDPDGSLGMRKYVESPYRPGEKMTVDDYYGWIFENSVPGLPETAKKQNLTPLQYMRKYGAYLISEDVHRGNEKKVADLDGTTTDDDGVVRRDGNPVGLKIGEEVVEGFPTPSRKLEFYSPTLKEWGWPEWCIPGYIRSHVHWSGIDKSKGEMLLLPTFRLPTLIHTRSGNSKWLYEISHRNPVWLHTSDAERLGVRTGDLVKVRTEIGYFVDKVWVTESIHPGVVACSHHLGRWRLKEETGGEKWSSALVELKDEGEGRWYMRQVHGVEPFESDDPDSKRVNWSDAGVHQNMTFPVQPDPISGQHCWHQKVRIERAGPDDLYGDIRVDTRKSLEVYRRWMEKTRPAPGPGNLRRPMWLPRPYAPDPETWQV